MQVVSANYTRYQNVLKILQTGAICKMDNSLFLKKDGRNFIDFALRYLHQEKQHQQKETEINSTELNELIDLAMEKAQGNYHNLIEMVS